MWEQAVDPRQSSVYEYVCESGVCESVDRRARLAEGAGDRADLVGRVVLAAQAAEAALVGPVQVGLADWVDLVGQVAEAAQVDRVQGRVGLVDLVDLVGQAGQAALAAPADLACLVH